MKNFPLNLNKNDFVSLMESKLKKMIGEDVWFYRCAGFSKLVCDIMEDLVASNERVKIDELIRLCYLENLIFVYRNSLLSDGVMGDLYNFLMCLPGFKLDAVYNQSACTKENFGYQSMALDRILIDIKKDKKEIINIKMIH